MAVYAHLPGAVTAGAVVADEVAVVVFRRLDPDGVFELRDDGQSGEGALAVFGRAPDAFRCGVGYGSGQAFEEEGLLAEAALEGQAGAVFEANGVWDLAFERADFLSLFGG